MKTRFSFFGWANTRFVPGRTQGSPLRLLTAHCSLLTIFLLLTAHCSLLTPAAYAAVSGSLQVVVRHTYTSPLDLTTPTDTLVWNIAQSFAAGTGDDQVNKVWHDKYTLASAASVNLDLAGGLTDLLTGAAVTFTTVKAVVIENLSTVRTLTVGNAAANAWYAWCGAATHTVTVKPAGLVVLRAPDAGFAVTAGTGDILKILNDTGTSCDFKIWIIGVGS